MRDVEAAWAAGIIDGEGCIHLRRRSEAAGYFALVLKVTMGHRPTIDRLHSLFDLGTIQENRSNKGHNPAWSWVCTTRQVGAVLDIVQPYLVTKADEAVIAREYLALPVMPGTRSIPPELAAARLDLFERMRDAKPSARFRS